MTMPAAPMTCLRQGSGWGQACGGSLPSAEQLDPACAARALALLDASAVTPWVFAGIREAIQAAVSENELREALIRKCLQKTWSRPIFEWSRCDQEALSLHHWSASGHDSGGGRGWSAVAMAARPSSSANRLQSVR